MSSTDPIITVTTPTNAPPSPTNTWPRRMDSLGRRALSAGRLRHERRKISKDLVVTVDDYDPFVDDRVALPTEQLKAKVSRSARSSKEIYFSPLDADGTTAFLSDPLAAPKKPARSSTGSTSTGRLSFMLGSFPSPPTTAEEEPAESKLTISPDDLDKLSVALAKSALVRSSLEKDYTKQFEKPSDGKTMPITPTTPLYSQDNKQFVRLDASECTLDFELSSGVLGAVTMLSSSDNATYIHSSSEPSDLTLDQQDCTTQLPEGKRHACRLHIVYPNPPTGSIKIGLQVLNTTVDYRTQHPIDYISVEHDFTGSFAKAALAELAAHAGIEASEITVLNRRDSALPSQAGEIDILALVDELQSHGETCDLVDDVLTKLTAIDSESCTMQTLTLMSELSRVYASSIDCIVVQTLPRTAKSLWRASIIQTSSSFADKIAKLDADPEDSPSADRASRAFLRKVCSMVSENAKLNEGYSVTHTEDLINRFECVPLYNNADASPYAWAAFVQSSFVHWRQK